MSDWVEIRKEFLTGLMTYYCRKYNITGWQLKFVEIENEFGLDAGAICHRDHKTIYVNNNHLGNKVPPGWHKDMFLHEFVHLLLFEQGNQICAVGLDGYIESYSHHGRSFRKLAYKIGVGIQCIPKY